jgi:hypothetical protein
LSSQLFDLVNVTLCSLLFLEKLATSHVVMPKFGVKLACKIRNLASVASDSFMQLLKLTLGAVVLRKLQLELRSEIRDLLILSGNLSLQLLVGLHVVSNLLLFGLDRHLQRMQARLGHIRMEGAHESHMTDLLAVMVTELNALLGRTVLELSIVHDHV